MVTNGRVIHVMGHGAQAPMFVLSGEVCTHQGLKARLPAPWWVQNRGGSGRGAQEAKITSAKAEMLQGQRGTRRKMCDLPSARMGFSRGPLKGNRRGHPHVTFSSNKIKVRTSRMIDKVPKGVLEVTIPLY